MAPQRWSRPGPPNAAGTGRTWCRTRSLRRISGPAVMRVGSPPSPSRPCVHESLSYVLEQHGQSLRLSDDGQEVRVAAPSRDDVLVQVGAHTCTSNSTLVDPNVVAHGRRRSLHRNHAGLGETPELQRLLIGQVDVERNVTIGAHQHVTGVVREEIHDDVAALATVDDQTFCIVLPNNRTEGAAFTGLIGRALPVDVNHPVWGPQTLEPVVDVSELVGRLELRPLVALLLRHAPILCIPSQVTAATIQRAPNTRAPIVTTRKNPTHTSAGNLVRRAS